MTVDSCSVIAVLSIAATANIATAQAMTELSSAQRAVVAAGRQVVVTTDVAGSSWPRTCIYERIDATPEEATAVFVDYDRHRRFIPGLKKSRVSRVVDRTTAEVDYTLDVPLVADEDYTVRDHVRLATDGHYVVDWTLVRATSTKATEGNVRFEPLYDDGTSGQQTLMAYCNLVTPGSRLAGLGFVKSRAMKQVRETARAIVAQVERERAGERALLDAQLRRLRAALPR